MAQLNRYRTGNQALVREINLSAIMNRLHEQAPLSRSALAEMTGLNKTTVSSLVEELINQQFVREAGFDTAGAGRPARLLEFNPNAGCIISAEIGVDFVSVICANFATNIIWRIEENTEQVSDWQHILDKLLLLFNQAIEAACNLCGPVLGLAIGVPGLVDQKTGTLLFAPNLHWENVPIGTVLRNTFNFPVFVDNEANMAALGEYYFGVARNYTDILYVSGGGGVGGGIVQGGKLAGGATGFAGEVGHMTIDPNGPLCSCGNRGCWETFINQKALFQRIQKTPNNGYENSLINNSELTVTTVLNAARTGDTVVLNTLEKTGDYLGIGIASLINILNSELVILGGIYNTLGEFLLPSVTKKLNQNALQWNANATKVVLAQQGSDACVKGGLARVYQAILTQPGTITN